MSISEGETDTAAKVASVTSNQSDVACVVKTKHGAIWINCTPARAFHKIQLLGDKCAHKRQSATA